jgi:hypothetical protein
LHFTRVAALEPLVFLRSVVVAREVRGFCSLLCGLAVPAMFWDAFVFLRDFHQWCSGLLVVMLKQQSFYLAFCVVDSIQQNSLLCKRFGLSVQSSSVDSKHRDSCPDLLLLAASVLFFSFFFIAETDWMSCVAFETAAVGASVGYNVSAFAVLIACLCGFGIVFIFVRLFRSIREDHFTLYLGFCLFSSFDLLLAVVQRLLPFPPSTLTTEAARNYRIGLEVFLGALIAMQWLVQVGGVMFLRFFYVLPQLFVLCFHEKPCFSCLFAILATRALFFMSLLLLC